MRSWAMNIAMWESQQTVALGLHVADWLIIATPCVLDYVFRRPPLAKQSFSTTTP